MPVCAIIQTISARYFSARESFKISIAGGVPGLATDVQRVASLRSAYENFQFSYLSSLEMKTASAASAEKAHPAPVPNTSSLKKLRAAAEDCTACPLYLHATQTVFGEGPSDAAVMMVGEQPGDREDVEGHPFVGPAGKLLDRALVDAGIDRSTVYVTNAVKHFKSIPRGKRRLHQKPNSREIATCKPWLLAELRSVQPRFLVLLGATAAQTVFGPTARVQRYRGRLRKSPLCEQTMITMHPSALLRAPDEASREEGYKALLRDFRVVAKRLKVSK